MPVMGERLRSVGLDVGTTTTQMILSELTVENRASGFAVPQLEIARRDVVYRGPVRFTPLISDSLIDGPALRELIDAEYRRAGITREDVDTGAVIITGETSRKENAATVLKALSDLAGDFVVATAGPDLESVLAAKGAGAVEYSRQTGKRVLHVDIGGGTSNYCLIQDGIITKTGCLNVGGRLLKFGDGGQITYVSPVLRKLCKLKVGDMPSQNQVEEVARMLVRGLEMVAGLEEPTELLAQLATEEAENRGIAAPVCDSTDGETVLSFSGGVADCIEKEYPFLEFGDMGPVLGRAIRESSLCWGEYRLGDETIRATVIGAGCHSAQLSGSTVFYRNVEFPMKNLPVVIEPAALSRLDGPGVLSLPGMENPNYDQVAAMAEKIAETRPTGPILIALEADMAKALGHCLALRVEKDRPVLCIDRVGLREGDYLDVGAPVGPALPVIVKTLVLGR